MECVTSSEPSVSSTAASTAAPTHSPLDCNALCQNFTFMDTLSNGCCSDQYCMCLGGGEGALDSCKGKLFNIDGEKCKRKYS